MNVGFGALGNVLLTCHDTSSIRETAPHTLVLTKEMCAEDHTLLQPQDITYLV